MASTLNASPSPSTFQSGQSSLLPRPSAVMTTRCRNVLRVIRSVAMVPAPAKPVTVRSRPVSDTMAKLMAKGKTAFIPYITAGDPDLGTTAEALRLLDACGADVIELGMPYSDPYVDGPIIQASSARALACGTTMDGVLAMLKEVTPELSCPIVLFSYYKPIFYKGLAEIKEAGVQGLLVPDLPYVAAHTLWSEAKYNNLELVPSLVLYQNFPYMKLGIGVELCKKLGIKASSDMNDGCMLVLLTTPTTPEERMKEITKASEGFVYLVSVNGVTGPRENVNSHVQSLIQEVKKVTAKPVAVGFGISKPEHVKQIAEWGADGVIIGSAMVRHLGEATSPKEGLKRLEKFAISMKNALP
ncbi:unnamed protein product [Urochloa humidicola]